MADQPINGLPKKTTVADTDSLLMIGASEEYQIDYGKLADALLNKLTSKTFTLDQGSKTLVAALNELNSKSYKFIDIHYDSTDENEFIGKVIESFKTIAEKKQNNSSSCCVVAKNNKLYITVYCHIQIRDFF